MTHFWEECWTEGQTDKGDFTEPSKGRWSNIYAKCVIYLTIANLWHVASRVSTCIEPESMVSWMKLCCSDNHENLWYSNTTKVRQFKLYNTPENYDKWMEDFLSERKQHPLHHYYYYLKRHMKLVFYRQNGRNTYQY